MKKIISKIKKSLHNTGSSLILVIVALAFIGILVGALLTAVAYTYRQKLYDYNARSNFYYLDQAMDEVYAGIGANTIKSLTDAYEKTREEVITFDLKSKSYKTMDDEEANRLFKNYFMAGFIDGANADYWKILQPGDTGYEDSICFAIRTMITNNTVTLDSSKMKIQYVYLSNQNNSKVGNDKYAYYTDVDDELEWRDTKDSTKTSAELAKIVIKNVRLTREAEYTRSNASGKFKQTISTDIEISRPDFNVNFGNNMIDLSTLFGYCMIADSGVDFDRISGEILTISGNVYAANDFYNKDYNKYNGGKAGFTDEFEWTGVSDRPFKMTKVSNYDYTSETNNTLFNNGQVVSGRSTIADNNRYNGKNDRSKYSGFYVDGGKVNILAETVIVPGSIAVMNGGSLSVYGINSTAVSQTNVWADEVILGGYSLPALNNTKTGSTAYFNANMYIKDDTQIEADWAKLSIAGEYYGFSNSESRDERSFIPTVAKQRASDLGNIYEQVSKNSAGQDVVENRGHYNSSAILINGENATLDLEKTTKMFIAGRSYIELSNAKLKKNTDPNVDANKGKGTANNIEVTTNTYQYNPTIQDYKTGESISVKPTQLAYYPSKASGSMNTEKTYFILTSGATGSSLNSMYLFKKYFGTDPSGSINIPLITQEVVLNPGAADEKTKTYYYFDFEQAVRDMKFDHAKFPASVIPDTYDGPNGNVEQNIKEYGETLKKQFIKDYCDYFTYCVNKNSDPKFAWMGYEADYDDPTLRAVGMASRLSLTDFQSAHTDVDTDILDTDRDVINKRVAELQNVTNYADFTISSVTLPEYEASSNTDLINTSGVTTSTKKVLDEVVKGTSTYYVRTKIDDNGEDTINSSLVGADETTANPNKTDSKANIKDFAKDYLLHYNMAKYALKDVYTADSAEAGKESEAQFIKKMIDANGEAGITPINYYMNYDVLDEVIDGSDEISPSNLDLGEYKVWASPGDVTISGASEITGIVVAKGDVYFDSSVNKFNGLILSGGKIYITTLNGGLNSVNSTSLCRNIMNSAISKASLYGADAEDPSLVSEAQEAKYAVKFLKLFKGYEDIAEKAKNGELKSSDEAKDITNIDYSDVLRYNNWMRNVD